jgi:uncharacterized protein DUF6152
MRIVVNGRQDVQRTLLALLIGAVALGVSTSAHHSFAAHYVEDQMVSIEGDLVQLEYRSPHSWIHVNAKDDTGVLRQVAAEWASAPRLKQWGVSEETLKPGVTSSSAGVPRAIPASTGCT